MSRVPSSLVSARNTRKANTTTSTQRRRLIVGVATSRPEPSGGMSVTGGSSCRMQRREGRRPHGPRPPGRRTDARPLIIAPSSHRVEPVTAISYPLAEHTLANGLRVLVSEDHTVPNVAVNLWVGVGSRHETPGRTGLPHLFEHLMFQASRNVASGEHFSALMNEGGHLNATTWFDRTNYFETVPTGALELALWLEGDRHGHLLDAVTQENLDNQRDVVKEEKRQRYDNVPYGTALTDVYATVFPEGHPYHHPTIGSMEDLDAASLEDVHAFFRHYYGPNNSVLTIVGDVDPDDAFAKVEKYFGPLPASAQPPPHAEHHLDPLTEPVRLERLEEVPNDRLHLAW